MDNGALPLSLFAIYNDDFAARVSEGRELNQQLLCSIFELETKFGVKQVHPNPAAGFGGIFKKWSDKIPSTDVIPKFNAVSEALSDLTVGTTPSVSQNSYLTYRHVNAKVMPIGQNIPITMTYVGLHNVPDEVSDLTKQSSAFHASLTL